MENLSDTLKQEAVDRGLCSKWTREWADNSSQQELIDKYKNGIDFVIEQGEWPTNDFIKAYFDRELLYDNRIFIDEYLNLDNAPSGIYILNGECSGVIHFNQWAAATVYVRHASDVTIIANDFAKVFVRLYDEAQVEPVKIGSAIIRIYDRR